jgi:thiamine transporter ThiT
MLSLWIICRGIKLLYLVLPLLLFVTHNLRESRMKIKILTFAALMAALANILSAPPIALPLTIGTFKTSIHFSQLPIFISGILAGPAAGLLTGAVGGLYMSFMKIPFIIGGLAILGCASGFFAKKLRPFFSGILAWSVQAPYVVITDYVWFISSLKMPQTVAWTIITSIMIKLTIEAILSSVLAEIVVHFIKRAGISF